MKLLFIVLSFTCCIMIACDKASSSCNENIMIEAQLEDVHCNEFYSESIVINTQEDLDNFVNNSCTSFDPLFSVNFTTNSLLGYRVSGSGCSRTFDASFTECSDQLMYTYLVTINEFGQCEPLETRFFIASVPKISADFIVNFETKIIQNPE